MGGQGGIDKTETHRGTTSPVLRSHPGAQPAPTPAPFPVEALEDWAHGYHGCVSLSPLQDSLRGPSS